MGLIFGLLWLSTFLAVFLLFLWAIGGLVHADGAVERPPGVFVIRAKLWFLYAELCPRDVVTGFMSLVGVVWGLGVSLVSADRWGEVLGTIKRNKLRTALTAISVAWGIFVLVVLLGMGHGLNNGIRYSFRREAQNGVFISANKTSVAWAGYSVGRRITFNNADYVAATKVKGIEHLSGQFFIRGSRFGGGEMKAQRGAKSNAFQVNAVHPDAYFMGANEIAQGRFLNSLDVATLRKAAVIGAPVRDFMFGPGEDPIGQWLVIGGVPFEVVGVYTDEGGEEEERQIYIPVSTAQLAYNGADRLGMIMFTVGDAGAAEAKAITNEIVGNLAAAHQFSPNDPQAARVFDNVEGFEKFQQFFLTISIFVVVIGLGTLAAGVVGVSNIMMIAVKERTKEIGIRKALGATPQSIVAMIVHEAVFLTSIAGLLGLSAGVVFLSGIPESVETKLVAVGVVAAPIVLLAVVAALLRLIPGRIAGWSAGLFAMYIVVVALGGVRQLIESELIRNPSIDVGVGLAAAIGLVMAGALAGFVPARAAARVNPIQTLRDQ